MECVAYLVGLAPSHSKRRRIRDLIGNVARAKAKVGTFRRRALAVALVVRCRWRPCQQPPILGHPAYCKVWPEALPNFESEPKRWKWKEKNVVGLDSVITKLEPSTLESFCTRSHDFLRLPRLMGTLCNYDYHVKQVKLALV
jgi:hypothetical protein